MDAETQARLEALERDCAKAIENSSFSLLKIDNALMGTFLKMSDMHLRMTRLLVNSGAVADPEIRQELDAIATGLTAICEAGAAEFDVLRTQLAVKRAFSQGEADGPPPA